MTLAEAPFWVWFVLALNSAVFLLMSLTPIMIERHRETSATDNLVLLVIESDGR
jgi:hypothetical protein